MGVQTAAPGGAVDATRGGEIGAITMMTFSPGQRVLTQYGKGRVERDLGGGEFIVVLDRAERVCLSGSAIEADSSKPPAAVTPDTSVAPQGDTSVAGSVSPSAVPNGAVSSPAPDVNDAPAHESATDQTPNAAGAAEPAPATEPSASVPAPTDLVIPPDASAAPAGG